MDAAASTLPMQGNARISSRVEKSQDDFSRKEGGVRRGMKGEPSREFILTCRGYAEVLGMVDTCWQHNYL